MAERIVSPGVFTRENDLSFLPQGIAQIGAAFVGPTTKGPAFRPVIVESQEQFKNKFGGMTSDFYTPYAVRAYLEEASRATVVRVLGLSGYDNAVSTGVVLKISGSGGTWVVGYIHPTRLSTTVSASFNGTTNPTEFSLVLSGSSGATTFTSLSIDSTSTRYFPKVLGTSPTANNDGYVYADFPRVSSFVSGALAGSGSMLSAVSTTELMLSGSVYGTYRNARTPVIRSQLLGGQRYSLFQFYTLSDGNAANTDIKVSITSIKAATIAGEYGTFAVLVRKFSDTDAKVEVLEQFDNLNLDPTSANYIARRIGTSQPTIDSNGDVYLEGEYPNNSEFIYVQMSDGVDDLSTDVLPYGFEALATPLSSTVIPAPAYVITRYATPSGGSTAVANNRIYYGFDFDDATGLSYLNATPSGSVNSALSTLTVGIHPSGSAFLAAGGADTGFDLLTMLSGSDSTDISVSTATSLRKFSVPFQGGFDGQNPAVNRYTGASIVSSNTMGFDLSDSSADGARAYALALGTIEDPDVLDINMLVTPGVIYSLHPYVAQLAMDLVYDRGDAFYVMDPEILGATETSVLNAISALDTSYTAVYHPWIKIFDSDNNKNVWAPPSVVMPKAIAFNDRVSGEWYAPAGLNRGGLSEALAVRTRLNKTSRDNLYEGRVNPIAQFPGQGIVVWGQKTLQYKSSALDRVNVRRLLIAVKKFIASASRYLVFEQNVDSTRQRFLSIVNPYLASVQERNGLYAFKVVMDDTNNTPDLIDRNILYGQLYLKPSRTAEFIILDFNILPTGTAFPE